MENPNFSRNRNGGEHLGVNKMGKNIKKSPIHQPNFGNAKQQPQPQVYNISKNDFRNVVQRLTGSPSQDPLPRPPHNPPKHPSMRLQKIRPPPLTPMNRPQIPPPAALAHFNNSVVRPGSIGQPSVSPLTTHIPGNPILANTAESPISAYMRDLNSIIEWDARQTHQAQPQFHAPSQAQGQYQGHPSSAGLLPTPPPAGFPSPRGNFPSPTSQFLLPSPSSYLNLLTPRSPYGLLSPGFQYPPPVTPNFSFSPWSQSGILGPGPQFPPSPAAYFPSSPSGLYPLSSPRWRDP